MQGNRIGRLEVKSNRLSFWPLAMLQLGAYQPSDLTLGVYPPWGLGIGGYPAVIVTDGSNKISILGNDTGGGSLYTEALLPTADAGPMGIAYDAARNATWVAENKLGSIAVLNMSNTLPALVITPLYCTIPPSIGSPSCTNFDPSTKELGPSTINSSSTIVQGVTYDLPFIPGWNATSGYTTVGIHQGPGGVSEYPLPSITCRPSYVAVDLAGDIWFTESSGNKIGRFSFPTNSSTAITNYVTSISTITVSSPITGNPELEIGLVVIVILLCIVATKSSLTPIVRRKVRQCTACGFRNPPYAKAFCVKCGHRLE